MQPVQKRALRGKDGKGCLAANSWLNHLVKLDTDQRDEERGHSLSNGGFATFKVVCKEAEEEQQHDVGKNRKRHATIQSLEDFGSSDEDGGVDQKHKACANECWRKRSKEREGSGCAAIRLVGVR